jgi:hypothetical protein
MFLTTHAAVGIVISQHIDKPLNIFLLALLSHFILDFIPHGDERLYHDEEWKIKKKYGRVTIISLIDAVLVSLMIIALYTTNDLPRMALISAGIVGSIFPDVVNHVLPIFHEKFNWLFVVRWLHTLLKKIQLGRFLTVHNKLHEFLHNLMKYRMPPKVGLSVQGVVFIVSLIFAFGFQ